MNPRPAISDALRKFNPFRDCSDEELDRLAAIATVAEYPPEAKLFEAGDTDSLDFYLLEGELSLSAQDGGAHHMSANSDTAKQAISRLRPRQYTATTQSPSRVLIIDSKQCGEIRKLSEMRQEAMYQVSECKDSEDLASLEVFFLLRTLKQEQAKLSEMTLNAWYLDITISTLPCYAVNWNFVLKNFKAGVGELLQMATYLVAFTLGERGLPEISELSSFNRLILFENRLNTPEQLSGEIAELLTRVRRLFDT